MNLSEQLTAKRAELVALKSAIESGDAEAIDAADAITAEIEGIEARAAKAAKASDMLAKIGNAGGASKSAPVSPVRTLGDYAVKNLDIASIRSGNASRIGTGLGFKASTDTHTSVEVQAFDRAIVDPVVRNLQIRNLFGAERISGNSLKYIVMGATEGAPAEVAEGATKPQFHIAYEAATAQLDKVAGWWYETDELIEDNEFLKSAIDARGLFELDSAVESKIVTELLATSGVQTLAPSGSSIEADDVFAAITNIKSATNYDADAILINPVDYQRIRLAKDNNNQYYGGGYFYAPYGTGAVDQQPGLWGLPTIRTNAVAQGTVVVGAFKRSASVLEKAGEGAGIEVVMGDHDDRINNRVTVIVEQRIALAVRVPAGFVKISA